MFYPRHLPGQELWLPPIIRGERSMQRFLERHRWMLSHGPRPKLLREIVFHSIQMKHEPISAGGSIRLVNGSDEYISVGTPAFTAHPSAHSIWFNRDTEDGSDQNAWYVGDKDAVSPRIAVWIKDSDANPTVTYFLDGNEGGVVQVPTTNFWSAATWHHAGTRSASVSDHSSYLDGDTANKGTATDTRTPNNYDTTSIGKFLDSTPSHPFDGMLAECAFWSQDVGEQNIVSLAHGFAPPLIDIDALTFYEPLVRVDTGTSWNDRVGGLVLTETNTPTVDDHPRMFYPSQVPTVFAPAGAVATTRRYTLPLMGVG